MTYNEEALMRLFEAVMSFDEADYDYYDEEKQSSTIVEVLVSLIESHEKPNN